MYAEKKETYGNRITTRKYHTWSLQKGGARQKRKKPTPEEIKKANFKMAKKRFLMKMIENFDENDIEATLTFKKELRPKNKEELDRVFKNFFGRLKTRYKRAGVELCYMGVVEKKPYHLHMVFRGYDGLLKDLTDAWGLGGVRVQSLYNDKDFKGLVSYWFKQKDQGNESELEEGEKEGQLYKCSRNLREPKVETREVKANTFRESVKVPPSLEKEGYVLDEDSIERGFDIFGYPFLEYTFIRYKNTGRRKRE